MSATQPTQEECDALAAAINSGVRKVEYAAGRSVEYHSIDQMQRVLAEMQQRVNAAAGRPPRAVFATRKGL